MLKEGWKEKAEGCGEGVEGSLVKEQGVGWKIQALWPLVSKLLHVDLNCRSWLTTPGRTFFSLDTADQLLWYTAGSLGTSQIFTSGRWRPTTSRRLPRLVSWVYWVQRDRHKVTQPSHHLRTTWTSATTSCVRALTSRSVKQEQKTTCWPLFAIETETIETNTWSQLSTFKHSPRTHPETLKILKSGNAQTNTSRPLPSSVSTPLPRSHSTFHYWWHFVSPLLSH